jgi:Na+(H+)/acetate symporter ActP
VVLKRDSMSPQEHSPKELTHMTTMTRPASDIAVGTTAQTRGGGRKALGPVAAVALAASLAGGIVGVAATALATQAVFNDQAAEQARLLQFADQLTYALRWDDLQRQMYPNGK